MHNYEKDAISVVKGRNNEKMIHEICDDLQKKKSPELGARHPSGCEKREKCRRIWTNEAPLCRKNFAVNVILHKNMQYNSLKTEKSTEKCRKHIDSMRGKLYPTSAIDCGLYHRNPTKGSAALAETMKNETKKEGKNV